jgi:CysZ protein
VTGFFLAVELSAIALERQGLRLSDRLRLLWRRRLLALGFGLAVFLLFLVPLGAVLGMPGAVAGGTLLARRLHA